MPEQDVLTFKTEQDKQNALLAIQDKPGGPTEEDIAQIEQITSAEITGEDINEPEAKVDLDVLYEDEQVDDAGQEPNQENEPVVEGSTEPQADNKPEGKLDKWVIDPNELPKDTYFDKDTNRTRPFFTQKNPEDLIKSYINAQKNNQYLKHQRIPQARESGYRQGLEEGKANASKDLVAAQEEIKQLKAQLESAKTQPKTEAPKETKSDIDTLLNELGDPDPDLEEVSPGYSKLHKLTKVLAEQNKTLNETIGQQQQTIESLSKPSAESVQPDQSQPQTDPNQQDYLTDQQRAQAFNLMVQDMDRIAPELNGGSAPSQSFREMDREAFGFKSQLVNAYFGQAVDFQNPQYQAMENEAVKHFLKGTPTLLNKLDSIGVQKPENWDLWVKLDEVDAMKIGYKRDPVSKEWFQQTTLDPISGQQVPVNLGSVDTALAKYKEEYGINTQKVDQARVESGKKLAKAINTRDQGVVSLDTNVLSDEGAGGTDLSPEQAERILQTIDAVDAQTAFRKGDATKLNQLNRAMAALGQPLIPEAGY